MQPNFPLDLFPRRSYYRGMPLTVKEAAVKLSVNEAWIRRLIKSGRLSASVRYGRTLVDIPSIRRYQRTRKGPGRPRKEQG